MDEEKRTIKIDEDCPLKDSNLCFWLSNKVGCHQCYIGTLKSKEQKEEACERWEKTLALLPREIDELHETDECQLCKGEVEQADGYAVFEMANPEPYFAKGMFFGFGKKVRTPVGSLVSIQVASCKKCRRAFRSIDLIQILSLIAGIVAGFLLLLIPQIAQPMARLFVLMPVIFIVLTGLAGYFIGKSASMAYLKKKARTVKLDLSEIPMVAWMLDHGWFFFQTTHGLPRVSFTKKKQYVRLFRKKHEFSGVDDDIPLDNINI